METTKYLTPEQVGERFLASKWTIRRWIESGKLPATRAGRRWLIAEADVEAFGKPTQVADDEARALASTLMSVMPGFHSGGLLNIVLCREHPSLGFWRELADGIRQLQAKTQARAAKTRKR